MDRELWVDDPQLVHWRLPSCAVVGNSGRLRVEHHAARIDAHDIVIRFNQGKTQTFEHLVGRKSSFRMFNGPYVGPKQGGEVTIAQVCTRSLSVVPQPAHEHPPFAHNHHMPCPTQRTHATGLWVARNTARCPFSAKDPLYYSAFLKSEAQHRTYALCRPAHLTVASARTWRCHSAQPSHHATLLSPAGPVPRGARRVDDAGSVWIWFQQICLVPITSMLLLRRLNPSLTRCAADG
jgi:hypothetical protein